MFKDEINCQRANRLPLNLQSHIQMKTFASEIMLFFVIENLTDYMKKNNKRAGSFRTFCCVFIGNITVFDVLLDGLAKK